MLQNTAQHILTKCAGRSEGRSPHGRRDESELSLPAVDNTIVDSDCLWTAVVAFCGAAVLGEIETADRMRVDDVLSHRIRRSAVGDRVQAACVCPLHKEGLECGNMRCSKGDMSSMLDERCALCFGGSRVVWSSILMPRGETQFKF